MVYMIIIKHIDYIMTLKSVTFVVLRKPNIIYFDIHWWGLLSLLINTNKSTEFDTKTYKYSIDLSIISMLYKAKCN